MTAEKRLEKIERELAKTKAGLANLVATLAAKTRTQSLQITGSKGCGHASLDVFSTGAELYLLDMNGKVRVLLGVENDGAKLGLCDQGGNARAVLAVGKDGPGLALKDENGETRAVLTVTKDGPGLYMLDEKGKIIWSAP